MNTHCMRIGIVCTLFLSSVAAGDPPEELKRQAERMRVERQRHRALAEHYFKTGTVQFDKMDFRAAREGFRKALSHDPGHSAAARMLRRCDGLIGDCPTPADVLLDRVLEERLIGRQRAANELNSRMARGRKLLAAGEFREAADEFERTLSIAKWLEPHLDVSDTTATAAKLLDQARKNAINRKRNEDRHKLSLAIAQARFREQERLEFNRRRLQTLLDSGERLMRRHRYDDAEKLFRTVVAQDPDHPRAGRLLNGARRLGRQAKRDHTAQERENNTALLYARGDEWMAAQTETLVYSPEWGYTKGIDRIRAEEEAEDPWKIELRSKLEEPISFDFLETPLEDVCQFLRQVADVDVILDPRVAEDANDPSLPVTLKVEDMPLSKAIKWINRLTGTSYGLHDNVIYIAPPDQMEGDAKLRVFDVGALRAVIRDFPGDLRILARTGQVTNNGQPRIAMFEESPKEEQRKADEEFIEFLKAVIGPGDWMELPDGRMAWKPER